jgi:pSer/pThr/pTyr-binding forkhead associated (FHA) protein
MGLFIALLDAATTDYFLELASGEQRGQQFVLFDNASIIGCARTVAVTLVRDPLVTEQHVRATKTSGGLAIECLKGAPAVLINGQSTQNGMLPVGGTIQIGNTVLILQSKKGKSVRPVGSVAAMPNSGAQAAQTFSNQPSQVSEPVRSRPTIQMNNKPKQ